MWDAGKKLVKGTNSKSITSWIQSIPILLPLSSVNSKNMSMQKYIMLIIWANTTQEWWYDFKLDIPQEYHAVIQGKQKRNDFS